MLSFKSTAIVIGLFLCSLLCWAQGGAADTPFTFDLLMEAAGSLAEQRLAVLVSKRGLAFEPSADQLAAIKRAGAGDEVLQAIKEAPRSIPAAAKAKEPPRPTPASLSIRCAPVECDVAIDGKSMGTTTGGVLTTSVVPSRPISFSVRKEGYLEGAEKDLVLTPASKLERSITLKPDTAYWEKRGGELLARLEKSLGGPDSLKRASSLTGTGSAIFYSRTAERSQWTLSARWNSVLGTWFRLSHAGTQFTISIKDDQYKASRNFNKHPQAADIENSLRLFRDYQLTSLLARIRDGKFSLSASAATVERILIATGMADIFEFTLDEAYLPRQVKFTSRAGLGSGLQVLYSGWEKSGEAAYPKEMIVRLPDAPQHGVEIRLAEMTLGANLTERDFR